jgi:hypothetical protein
MQAADGREHFLDLGEAPEQTVFGEVLLGEACGPQRATAQGWCS